MQTNKLLGALGLCRRAGKLALGSDRVLEQAARGRAALVLLAADASGRTARRMREGCEGLCPVRTLPLTQTGLLPLTNRPTAVLAVLDENLARLCGGCLDAAAPPDAHPAAANPAAHPAAPPDRTSDDPTDIKTPQRAST